MQYIHNYPHLTVYNHIAIVIMSLGLCVCLAFQLNVEGILRLLGQDHEVARYNIPLIEYSPYDDSFSKNTHIKLAPLGLFRLCGTYLMYFFPGMFVSNPTCSYSNVFQSGVFGNRQSVSLHFLFIFRCCFST